MSRNLILSLVLNALIVPITIADESHPVDFDAVDWQRADRSDLALFEPYVGTFRGTTHTAESGVRYFFTITYAWYDRPKTILKYTLETHLPDRDEVRPLGEGFYRFDPVGQRIEVVGVFRDGRAGRGFMSPFDVETGAREVRIRGLRPDGVVNEVRDTFWIVDENRWGNRTYIANQDGDWELVSEDLYQRMEPESVR